MIRWFVIVINWHIEMYPVKSFACTNYKGFWEVKLNLELIVKDLGDTPAKVNCFFKWSLLICDDNVLIIYLKVFIENDSYQTGLWDLNDVHFYGIFNIWLYKGSFNLWLNTFSCCCFWDWFDLLSLIDGYVWDNLVVGDIWHNLIVDDFHLECNRVLYAG